MLNVSKRDDSSSILEIGERQIEVYPGTDKSHIEKVKITPLINHLKINDFKKI